MKSPLANLPIQKNVIWTPKRSGGKIVFASLQELQTIVQLDAPLHFVWPDEGDFLKLIGSEDTFKMKPQNDTLPPLVVAVKDAKRILRLYNDADRMRQRVEGFVSQSRGGFARIYDAAVSYEQQMLTSN